MKDLGGDDWRNMLWGAAPWVFGCGSIIGAIFGAGVLVGWWLL